MNEEEDNRVNDNIDTGASATEKLNDLIEGIRADFHGILDDLDNVERDSENHKTRLGFLEKRVGSLIILTSKREVDNKERIRQLESSFFVRGVLISTAISVIIEILSSMLNLIGQE